MEYTEAIQAIMNRQIKKDDDVAGALRRVYCPNYDKFLIVLFEDGRWAMYVAHSGYDNDLSIELYTGDPAWGELEGAGLITAEERRAQVELDMQIAAARQRAKELELLAKLRAKYE